MYGKRDTIGIFSSSYPLTAIDPLAAQNAIDYLEQNGCRVKKGKLFGKADFYRSGTIQERAQEFNELLYDSEVDCLMASVGGMVSNALLPYIDFEYLRQHPKKIIGHSDITAILLAVYEKTGITTFYGPNLVTTFGQPVAFIEYSLHALMQILSEKFPLTYEKSNFYSDELTVWGTGGSPKTQLPNQWTTVQPGSATGRVIGGNLNTISAIMASPYMPKVQKGDILFLSGCQLFFARCR